MARHLLLLSSIFPTTIIMIVFPKLIYFSPYINSYWDNHNQYYYFIPFHSSNIEGMKSYFLITKSITPELTTFTPDLTIICYKTKKRCYEASLGWYWIWVKPYFGNLSLFFCQHLQLV